MKLLNEINEKMKEVGIHPKDRMDIYRFLKTLRLKDPETYNHSIRVALLSLQAAEVLKIDKKAMLMSGCLHDFGKIMIDNSILHKENFGIDDMKIVSEHPIYSYNLLYERFGFTADVVVRHHYWQENGYPEKLPKLNEKYSEETKEKINYYSRILAIIDFYDAITTRNNGKYAGEKSPEKIKEIILEKNPDLRLTINQLYEQKVLK